MNARALAAWSAAALVVTFASSNPAYKLVVVAAALMVLIATRRRGRSLSALLRATMIAAAAAVVLSTLLSHTGSHVVFVLPDWLPGAAGPITLEALSFGLATAAGLTAAVLAVAPLSYCLEPHEVMDALPAPLHRTGTALAASLNMVPGIGRSLTAVREAELMRGWRPRGPRSWSEVLVPVLLTTMEDSIQLAEAMEARGFGGGRRSRLLASRWRLEDVLVATCACGAAVTFALGARAGLIQDWYPYPDLSLPVVSPLLLGVAGMLAIPVLTWRSPASTS